MLAGRPLSSATLRAATATIERSANQTSYDG